MSDKWNLQGIGMTSQRTRDRMVARLREQGITHAELLQVMTRLPRHIFIDDALSHRAYEDVSLPIGFQQTISQPWIVAKMTELLLEQPERPKRVLELGTGSGYQTAVLASLFAQVFSIERIGSFQDKARARFSALKLNNITLRHGDGYQGWPAKGEFDAILITAAPEFVPEALLEQLAPNGCIILPLGAEQQKLVRVTKTESGSQIETITDVKFVPLVAGVA